MRDDDYFNDFNDAFYYAFRNHQSRWWNFRFLTHDEEKLLKEIKKETIGYFGATFQKDMSKSKIRKSLSKEEKERVVGFMKKRLEYYNTNGFVIEK